MNTMTVPLFALAVLLLLGRKAFLNLRAQAEANVLGCKPAVTLGSSWNLLTLIRLYYDLLRAGRSGTVATFLKNMLEEAREEHDGRMVKTLRFVRPGGQRFFTVDERNIRLYVFCPSHIDQHRVLTLR
jgi:hypothetical protein